MPSIKDWKLSLFAAALLSAGAAVADVVVVVSAQNAVAGMGQNHVMDIFLGRVNKFPDGSPAVPIDQAEDSALREEFYLKVTGKSQSQLKAHWSKLVFTGRGQPPRRVSDSAAVKAYLQQNPNAIGYIDSVLLDDSLKVVFP